MKFLGKIRQERGFTQAELAEKVGVGVNTIARYERSEMTPSLTVGHAIANVLNVSEAELLNGPVEEKWVLEIKIANSREEVIDMTGTMPCVASITGTPFGANLELSAKWETFRDDAKFQEFIDQVVGARKVLLDMGTGMEKLKGAKGAKA